MSPKTRSNDLDTIDRSAYEPAYSQLAGILRRKIAEGAYRPGEAIALFLRPAIEETTTVTTAGSDGNAAYCHCCQTHSQRRTTGTGRGC